jgi:ribonuclease HI
MTVNPPKTASKTWRAILAGRQALETGLIKQIGDGSTVSVWDDKWIPGICAARLMGSLIATDVERVEELIDLDLHQWRSQLVRNIFFAPDAELILQIPLRRSIGEDWVAWHHEKSGVYSVRSAYHALVANKDEEKWKRLWKLDVLPRVRVFWWRVLKGILPDYATLTRRHIRDNSTCAVCKSSSESLYHALMECAHAKLFWAAAGDIFHMKLPRLHPDSWTEDILCGSSFNQGERERIISIMFAIWDSRYRWTHDSHGYDPSSTMQIISDTMGHLENKKEQKSSMVKPFIKWQAPRQGIVKLNSDGAIREESGVAASGGVARDARGFKGAWCRTYHAITDPLIIEALALRDSVLFAKQQGFMKVIFETDCEQLVRLWNDRRSQRSSIAPILSEVEEYSFMFLSFDLCFVRRTANSVAHECAQYACVHDVEVEWVDAPPDFLSLSLRADCTNLAVF